MGVFWGGLGALLDGRGAGFTSMFRCMLFSREGEVGVTLNNEPDFGQSFLWT